MINKSFTFDINKNVNLNLKRLYKKKLLLTVLVLFSFISVHSQDIRFGAKMGLNLARIGGDNYSTELYGIGNYGYGIIGTRTGFHIGAIAEIPLKDKLFLQPEILYSSEGSTWKWGLGESKTKLDFIRLPVLAKYYFIEGLSAEAGPVFGFLINAKREEFDPSKTYNVFVIRDVINEYKTIDAALAIGATYRLNMGIFFSLRYNKGLLNINKGYTGELFDYRPAKNQSNVFQVSAGYSF